MSDAHRLCAWCGRDLGLPPVGLTADTHGICPACTAEHFPRGCAWCDGGDGLCADHAAAVRLEADVAAGT
jgi:hypothetical protein